MNELINPLYAAVIFVGSMLGMVMILSNRIANRRINTYKQRELLQHELAEHERKLKQLDSYGIELIEEWLNRQGKTALPQTTFGDDNAPTTRGSRTPLLLLLFLIAIIVISIYGPQ